MGVFDGFRISSGYGMRVNPISGKKKMHTGIDIVKADKSPVTAFASGVVVHAKMGATGTGFGGFGNVVAVKDAQNAIHVYAHLNSVNVSVGQTVGIGSVLGSQGSTGKSTGSHLHYEVRKKGSSASFGYGSHVDPTTYLSGMIPVGKSETPECHCPPACPTCHRPY